MEPINKKEINSSFLMFVVMFVITILFAIVCVFFDVKFYDKDYSNLRKELNETKGKVQFFNNVPTQIDSIKNVLKNLKEQNKTEFDIKKTELLNNLLIIELSDTSLDGKLKNSIHDFGIQWLNDKQRLLDNADLQIANQSLKKQVQGLSTRLIQKGDTKEQVTDVINASK